MSEKPIIGWREFCALPSLNIPAIKAKIDTGARTSSLHTASIEPFEKNGKLYVKFIVHPLQNNLTVEIECIAETLGQREIKNSGGDTELRYVIKVPIKIGAFEEDIELTLANREEMKFRMLLGREALSRFALIDTSKSYCTGRYSRKKLITLYSNH